MQVSVEQRPIDEVVSDAIVLLLAADSALDGAAAVVSERLGGLIETMRDDGDFSGKAGQVATVYARGALAAKRVLLVGLGEQKLLSTDALRRAMGAAARAVQGLLLTECAVLVPKVESLAPMDVAQALAEGTLLGSYSFCAHKTLEETETAIERLILLVQDDDAFEALSAGAERGRIVAESVCQSRDLQTEPANFMTPTILAEKATEIAAEVGLSIEVLDESQMAALGMGSLLGVAQGSNEPAQFIILGHNMDRDDLDTYVVVGKGITFDSGGLSLKPVQGMEAMKYDMSGAAVTLGVLRAAALLKMPLRVIGLMPATENMPGGRAYKPGDVLESMSGITIEVISTDAEGRLILADALHYAGRYEPKAIVDLATLTGGCVVALGHVASGLMGNDSSLVADLLAASKRTGEKVWELPLFDEYEAQIKSAVADVKNSGGRTASAITAGLFLQHFVGEHPWAHLDIAGTAWSEETVGDVPKGATGHGVRLLVDWLTNAVAG